MARRVMAIAAVLAAASLLALGCGGEADGGAPTTAAVLESSTTSTTAPPTTTTTRPLAPDAFDGADASFVDRIRSAGLSGGVLRVVDSDGGVLHDRSVGSVNGSTPLSVASSTKWLTAATLMTLVDDGLIGLDDDIARWLPEFADARPVLTARQLLTHTSGVRDHPCQSNGSALAGCVRAIAGSARQFPAGSAFSYGNSSFLVVGRLIEVVAGIDFATAVTERVTGPLGMTATTWPGAPNAANPAFGVRVTVDDYGKFLDMILHEGTVGGVPVLTKASVWEMIGNQVGDYDVSRDFSVGITKIPRYGLGCWPDTLNVFTGTAVVSGNGGKGFYPWVDFDTRTWGIVGVQDDRGAPVAVPASQRVQQATRSVLTG
ncbi:MAG: serine hydrolase domain-containing protein [Acidimicrobiia bacterium]